MNETENMTACDPGNAETMGRSMEDFNCLADEYLPDVMKRFCPNCGEAVPQNTTGRPRKFCSTECCNEWWRRHPKKGGLHAGELKAYIQLCLAMSELAKEVKYASPKPQQTDNEKYAFRCWMLRLGFIGEEFATAREILLRNMEGNASWRNA